MKRTRMYQNLLPALDTQRRITNRMRRPWRSSRLKWATNCSQAYTMYQWLHVIMSKWNVGALAAAELPRLRCAGLMSAQLEVRAPASTGHDAPTRLKRATNHYRAHTIYQLLHIGI
jgi:hypothetical protein